MKEKELSIIIPSYQAGKWIKKTITELIKEFPQAEIIVVNDGSTDETKEVKDFFNSQITYLENQTNQGKGYSLRKGFQNAQGRYIIFTDADLPFGIQGINQILIKLKENIPVVIGKRNRFYNDKFFKHWLRPLLYLILRLFFFLSYHDTQCGLKGFSREAGKEILSHTVIKRFAIDIEILFLARKGHYQVEEAIVYQDSFPSSTFDLKNIIRVFWDLLIIRFHHYESF